MDPPGPHGVKDAFCLLKFGDSITTDHISPAGSIHKDSPAAKYLLERGVDYKDFNSYGSRRGNDEVMARGTFANIRLVNKLLNGEVGPKTIHIPTGEKLYVFDAAMVSPMKSIFFAVHPLFYQICYSCSYTLYLYTWVSFFVSVWVVIGFREVFLFKLFWFSWFLYIEILDMTYILYTTCVLDDFLFK